MAHAAKLKGEKRRAVAVIGDGAMTAGMAFEALNNAGVSMPAACRPAGGAQRQRHVDQPAGGRAEQAPGAADERQVLRAAREGAKSVLKNTPLYELARRFEEHAKGMVVPGTIFEEFGFNYVGPIDGHDLDALIPTLENLRGKRGPQFLHVVTKKGYGYKLAEADPVNYHGPRQVRPGRGPAQAGHAAQAHLHAGLRPVAVRHGRGRRAAGGITPAMREGSGMVEFHKRFPKRYHDVGIAEQHAVTFAAGLACEGLKPVVAIYSTFLQRGYDQLIHDVALQNLPVVFALDRAGIVGADGATHCGAYDIAYLRCVPNMSLLTPADEDECRQALTTAFRRNHPVAVRYPRGAGVGRTRRPEV
jgi:1-deoxy-D-xylulose-5-phosphate synthase